MTVLDEILSATRSRLPAVRIRIVGLRHEAATRVPPADFATALRRERLAVIAEVKRRSPSAGSINPDLDPVALAAAYASGGAAAVSVLTNESHFGGSIGDLARVTATQELPVLMKDFIIDEVQLLEARANGAAAVLLIVRALAQADLERLVRQAAEHELQALVEVHTAEERDRALGAGATVIGVNARDLDDFSIDVDRAWELLASLPRTVVAVAESGMRDLADVTRAAAAGADAVLVGGALASASDPRGLVRAFSEVPRRGR
jgi:indole-3-glycerol phosphate synthase